MPTTVVDDPLGISCVFSDGRSAEFDLSDLPNPRLTRDLATGLVELIHPHGSADSRSTVDGYVAALRAMVRALAEQGFTGGADGLRRGHLAQFWMAGPTRLEALTRGLVEGYARSGGVLGDGVLELAVVVSRSWLYAQADIRAEIDELRRQLAEVLGQLRSVIRNPSRDDRRGVFAPAEASDDTILT